MCILRLLVLECQEIHQCNQGIISTPGDKLFGFRFDPEKVVDFPRHILVSRFLVATFTSHSPVHSDDRVRGIVLNILSFPPSVYRLHFENKSPNEVQGGRRYLLLLNKDYKDYSWSHLSSRLQCRRTNPVRFCVEISLPL